MVDGPLPLERAVDAVDAHDSAVRRARNLGVELLPPDEHRDLHAVSRYGKHFGAGSLERLAEDFVPLGKGADLEDAAARPEVPRTLDGDEELAVRRDCRPREMKLR